MKLQFIGNSFDGFSGCVVYEEGIDPKLRLCPHCGSCLLLVQNLGREARYVIMCLRCSFSLFGINTGGYNSTDWNCVLSVHKKVFRDLLNHWNGKKLKKEEYLMGVYHGSFYRC